MKKAALIAVMLGSLALVGNALVSVQAQSASARKTFQYASLGQMRIGQQLFFSFTTGTGQGASANALEEVIEKVTVRKVGGQSTYPQALDSLGADGWELVQVVDRPGGQLDFYFKRPTP